jgi:hypothetical protein
VNTTSPQARIVQGVRRREKTIGKLLLKIIIRILVKASSTVTKIEGSIQLCKNTGTS